MSCTYYTVYTFLCGGALSLCVAKQLTISKKKKNILFYLFLYLGNNINVTCA